jgi:hypothetical protein
MASIVIQRNIARGRESDSAGQGEVEVDYRPEYLKNFPSASDILNDFKLAVLLGRCRKMSSL